MMTNEREQVVKDCFNCEHLGVCKFRMEVYKLIRDLSIILRESELFKDIAKNCKEYKSNDK